MKEKLNYQDAEIEIILFNATDIVTSSIPEKGNDGGNIDGGAWH